MYPAKVCVATAVVAAAVAFFSNSFSCFTSTKREDDEAEKKTSKIIVSAIAHCGHEQQWPIFCSVHEFHSNSWLKFFVCFFFHLPDHVCAFFASFCLTITFIAFDAGFVLCCVACRTGRWAFCAYVCCGVLNSTEPISNPNSSKQRDKDNKIPCAWIIPIESQLIRKRFMWTQTMRCIVIKYT